MTAGWRIGLHWGLLALLLQGPLLRAESGVAQIRFTYENPKLQPQKYVVTVDEDGNGHFFSQAFPVAADDSAAAEAGSTAAGSQDRPIHISKGLRGQMFAVARKYKLFTIACDAHEKNIAFQGTKTLQYDGPDGKGSCQYNWSKISQINQLTDQFEAVAATLDEGSKLQREYEHGRLSLDSELEFLTEMAEQGRATEIENIAPILQTLVKDDAVLQRVQRKAQALLERIKTDQL